MDTPADLIYSARTGARLSIRALAERAHVSASTVSRIESGSMDPTVGMLRRLLESAGQDLELAVSPAHGPRLSDLSNAWRSSTRGDVIDWTRLRAFLDHLAQHPENSISAIREKPTPCGSLLLDNLLAGIAETISIESGTEPPTWVFHVDPLTEPWVTPGTPRIQQQAFRFTPAAFAARGITLNRSSLWREHVDA